MRYELTLATCLLAVACVSSSNNPPPAALPPCAAGDVSWGCHSQPTANPGTPSSPVAPAPGVIPTQPLPAGTGASMPAAAPPQQTAQTPAPAAVSVPPMADDGINLADAQFQRSRVTSVVAELIGALDATTRSRVENLPLAFDPDRNNVNAFATCTQSGKATIAVTDGLLVLSAYLAQVQASDEALGTRHFDEYVGYVAQNQQPDRAILPPTPTMVPAQVRNLPTKMQRQQLLNDEILAFVMGHELAHHYLNHLPCTSILPLNASELGVLLTEAVPSFNQPNEMAADTAGIRNVLDAGRRRASNQLTEGGALLMLRFFRALDQARPIDMFNFERTHPPPSVREPVVQVAVQAYRATGGISWPWQR